MGTMYKCRGRVGFATWQVEGLRLCVEALEMTELRRVMPVVESTLMLAAVALESAKVYPIASPA